MSARTDSMRGVGISFGIGALVIAIFIAYKFAIWIDQQAAVMSRSN